MNILQAQALLKKMQHLCDAVASSPTDPSRIEIDLLKDYTRRFYEIIDLEIPASEATPVSRHFPTARIEEVPKPPQVAPKSDSPSISSAPEIREETPQQPIRSFSPPVPPKPEPVKIENVPSYEEKPVEVYVAQREEEEKPAPIAKEPLFSNPTAETVVVRKTLANKECDVLFEVQQSRDLSDKLRFSKIDDLSKSMGINERFLTINELFGGNHEVFDTALRDLNAVPTFDAARTYIETELVPKFNWLDTGKQKKAQVFIQLVYRRFV